MSDDPCSPFNPSIHGLYLQKQPTPVTCVQTCLAMALGVHVADVIARYGDAPMNGTKLRAALDECEFFWNQFIGGALLFEGWYFAVVPSLNVRGGLHQILLHYDGAITVLDPSAKIQYLQDGSDLVTWTELTPFERGGKLP